MRGLGREDRQGGDHRGSDVISAGCGGKRIAEKREIRTMENNAEGRQEGRHSKGDEGLHDGERGSGCISWRLIEKVTEQ